MVSKPDNISPGIATPETRPAASLRKGRYSTGATGNSAPRATPSGGGEGASLAVESAGEMASPVDWSMVGLALGACGICFLAFYPSELMDLQSRWYTDAGWSHGYIVPLISVFLISIKWDSLRQLSPQGSWMGLAILLLGVTGQVVFRATGTQHMSNLSMLVLLLGASLFIFGWQYLKVLWLPIGYLACAIPLPGALYVKVTTPMQELAARVGVRLLTLFGGEAERRGTVIDVPHDGTLISLNVEQACSGMRMLVAFFALAVALAYSTNRPIWQKLFLAACAIPIAIFCNALRVTLTAALVARWGDQWAKGSAHEYFGLLMLIPAMFMQLGLAWILDRIFIEEESPAAPVAGGLP